MHFFWFCTALAAIAGGVVLLATLILGEGTPKVTAGATIALCIVVIPYVFTRAIEGWQTATRRAEMSAGTKRRGTSSSGAASAKAAAALPASSFKSSVGSPAHE